MLSTSFKVPTRSLAATSPCTKSALMSSLYSGCEHGAIPQYVAMHSSIGSIRSNKILPLRLFLKPAYSLQQYDFQTTVGRNADHVLAGVTYEGILSNFSVYQSNQLEAVPPARSASNGYGNSVSIISMTDGEATESRTGRLCSNHDAADDTTVSYVDAPSQESSSHNGGLCPR